MQNERILEGMADGVVLLDSQNTILWGNGRLCEWSGRPSCVGEDFYKVLDSPEILGPDFCPFRTALATGQGTISRLRSNANRYYQIHAAPLCDNGQPPERLVVTIRDVTEEVHQQQKLVAIHQAGIELTDLAPEELLQMSGKERIELLKSNILHYTKDLLNYEVVEIRLLDQKTGRLAPLLETGMEPAAAQRELFASLTDNGVTGFVAASGKSYLCEDTADDPLYLEGARDAKSSLTVPLMLHAQVIGTFNVESRHPRAFNEGDLQFLEIFGRDVAAALNTYDLLLAEKGRTAAEACEVIHSAVALPVDEILNEAVHVMEKYIGHDHDVVERLQKILRNARDIKQLIQRVGQKMAPGEAHPQVQPVEPVPGLRGKRILVVDADESVRSASHNLLERYGCDVETAQHGAAALSMFRGLIGGGYDLVLSEIRLPDMNACELMQRLHEVMSPVRLVLMTGFGWDPEHVVVKCRQAGLPPNCVLLKPFRLDQLLSIVRQGLAGPAVAPPPAAEPT